MGKHFERGSALFDLRRYWEAVEELSRELEENPQSAVALSLRAAALLNLGYSDSAEEDVRSSIALDPELAYSLYVLSATYLRRGELASAEEAILGALRIESGTPWFAQLAAILYASQRFAECLTATERALELNPYDARSLLLRSKALSATGRHDEAEQVLSTALALDPENPAAHHVVGEFALNSGRARDSLGFLREARRLDPIGYNDSESIAHAYGRCLLPFRLIDRFIPRWYVWPEKQRWAVYTFVGTFALALGLSFAHTSRTGFGAAFLCYIFVVNILAFSISYREIVSTVAKLVAKREVGATESRFNATCRCVIRLVFRHLHLSGLLGIVAVFAPLPFLVYAAVANFGLFSGFLHVASIRHALAYVAVGVVPLVLALAGAATSITAPVFAVAAWVALAATSYFSTDVSHWIIRPRATSLRLLNDTP